MHSASDFDAMVLLPVKPYMHTRYSKAMYSLNTRKPP